MSATEEQVAAAVIAALAANDAQPYDLDDAPKLGDEPNAYTLVSVTRMFGGTFRVGADRPGEVSYRIATREVGRTITGAREERRRVGLWEGQSLTADPTGTPIDGVVVFESQDALAADDGWFSGLTTWTLTL